MNGYKPQCIKCGKPTMLIRDEYYRCTPCWNKRFKIKYKDKSARKIKKELLKGKK